jgi:hypothetical protein
MWAQVTNDGVGVSASIRSASGPQGATIRSTQVRDVRRRRQVTVWLRLRLRARVWCVRSLCGRCMLGRRRRCVALPPQQVRARCQWHAMMPTPLIIIMQQYVLSCIWPHVHLTMLLGLPGDQGRNALLPRAI